MCKTMRLEMYYAFWVPLRKIRRVDQFPGAKLFNHGSGRRPWYVANHDTLIYKFPRDSGTALSAKIRLRLFNL